MRRLALGTAVVVMGCQQGPNGGTGVLGPEALLDSVVAARKCAPSSFDHLQLNCKFTVDTAAFEIVGVGASDAQLAFDAADVRRTWVAFGLAHQCVMVKNQRAVVFVSPKNAKAYADWPSCSGADMSGR